MPKLTKRFVDSLAPVSRDTLYRDTEISGFTLRAKPSGVLTWPAATRSRFNSSPGNVNVQSGAGYVGIGDLNASAGASISTPRVLPNTCSLVFFP